MADTVAVVEEIVETQDEVVKCRFSGHPEKLERLRVTLAGEHGQSMRSDQEAARLAAQDPSAPESLLYVFGLVTMAHATTS